MFRRPKLAGDLTDGRDRLAAFSPEQVTENPATREASRIDTPFIHAVGLIHCGHHRVKEIQIAVSHVAPYLVCFVLPARLVSRRIGEAWRNEALRIDDNRFRPERLEMHL